MHWQSNLLKAFQPLVGLPITIARNAAGMKNFGFGRVTPSPSGRGTVGQYALHIDCPWRITGPAGIVTGSSDRHRSPSFGEWAYKEDWAGTDLQEKNLDELLGGLDRETGLVLNLESSLTVEAVEVAEHGKLELILSAGYSLQIFPDGSGSDYWRLFIPGDLTSHFVYPPEHPE